MNTQAHATAASRALRAAAIATASVAVLLAGCGDSKKDKPASQTAAKVNKEEITVHQINFVLQQQRGLKPEQVDAAGRQVLERLIDQELALQKAGELKVDRDPRVVQQLEAARREIISRGYLEKLGEGAPKPSPEEVKKYYDENPALFSERRVYQLQEFTIETPPEQVPALRDKLQAAKNMGEFVAHLKANNIKFVANQAVRAAEQLPLATVGAFAKLKDGQALVNTTPKGMQVIFLAGSRSQPVDLERARTAIEQFLHNERKRKVIADDLKALRAAAKVEYVGKYAEGAASAAAAAASVPAAPSPASAVPPMPPIDPPAPAASGPLDTSVINKGLGIK